MLNVLNKWNRVVDINAKDGKLLPQLNWRVWGDWKPPLASLVLDLVAVKEDYYG